MKRDSVTICAELDASAAMLYLISQPMLEEYNHATDQLIGEALHGIGCFLERISEDVGEYYHLEKENNNA
jgi:hypothetical protein